MIFLTLIIALHIFVLSRLIFLPYPELFVYPYLTNHGLLPYRDILDQHFPGLMFLPINLGNLRMTTPGDARIWQYGTVAIIQILIFLIGRKIFKSESKALIANLLFLVWQPFFEGWVLWIDSMLPVFLLPAFYYGYQAFEKGKRKDLILSGLFLGISLLFKQVVAPLIAIVFVALYLKRKSVIEILYFLLGLLPVPLFMLIYIISKGIFADFWYWTVVFNLTTFAEFGRRGATLREFVQVAVVYCYSLLAILIHKFRGAVVWLLLFAVGTLFSANARFDFVHFQPSLPFICLMSVIAFDYLRKRLKFGILAYFGIMVVFLFSFYRATLGNRVYFFGAQDYQIVSHIEQLTKSGERIFLFGTPFNYYQMSRTLPAGNIFVFQFPWFMMVAEDRILTQIQKDMPSLVVADRTVTVDGQEITNFAPKINEFLLQNYQIYDKIGSVEFLRLKKQYAYMY